MTAQSRSSRHAQRLRAPAGVHWGFLSQAAASVTNLVPAVAIAREVSSRSFAAFAIASVTALFGLGLVRSFVGEPLLVVAGAGRRERADGVLELALLVGLGVGAIAAVVGLTTISPSPLRTALLLSLVVVPAIAAQDASRYALFAMRRHRSAFLNDLAWLGMVVVGFLLLPAVVGGITVANGLLLWAGTGACAAILARRQLGLAGRGSPALVASEVKPLGGHLAAQFVAMSGASHLSLYLLGIASSLTDVGAVRGAQVVFGPLQVIFVGATVTLFPRGLQLGPPQRFRRTMMGATIALTALGLLHVALLVAIPTSVGAAILGDTWEAVSDLVVPYGAYMLSLTLATGGNVGLTLLERARTLSLIRFSFAPLFLVLPVLAAGAAGAAGYLWAQAGVGLTTALWWWAAFVRAQRLATVPETVHP